MTENSLPMLAKYKTLDKHPRSGWSLDADCWSSSDKDSDWLAGTGEFPLVWCWRGFHLFDDLNVRRTLHKQSI